MVKKFFKNKKFKNKMLKNIPLGRVAKESDVATAVAFLAADTSEMITGTSLSCRWRMDSTIMGFF